jgi:hypothetical protein
LILLNARTHFSTHVYLGPSLDLDTAKALLPEAHFHPPIQCGDIIRLLRLEPKKIIIIDGLYEIVAAVWHKEILLAMELGVEVWGAASMGALRAAELHHYGMNGFGQIYEDFKKGVLNDDDEVAVLHKGSEEQFSSVNDAMVNIRATCEYAWSEGILSTDEKNKLVAHCKAQFYPYRSLHQAIKQQALENTSFAAWFQTHGIIDIKRKDAIAVLEHNRQVRLAPKTPVATPMSIFIKELLYYAHLTPFTEQATWLPTIEKQLQALNSESPNHYMLMAELAFFSKKLFLYQPNDLASINNEALLEHIKQQKLYSPAIDFKSYKNHPMLHPVYLLICRSVCSGNISNDTITQFLPAIAHYYDIENAPQYEKLLRSLLVVILSTNIQKNTTNLELSTPTVTNHFNKIARNRRYNKEKFKAWYNPTHMNVQSFRQFLTMYLKIVQGQPTSNNQAHFYFKWIYDAYAVYCE